VYFVSCHWNDELREDWEKHKAYWKAYWQRDAWERARPDIWNDGYTKREINWMMGPNYGSMFSFLWQHGLNTHKNDDQEEAKIVLRKEVSGVDA
jgi:hypothetical protein